MQNIIHFEIKMFFVSSSECVFCRAYLKGKVNIRPKLVFKGRIIAKMPILDKLVQFCFVNIFASFVHILLILLYLRSFRFFLYLTTIFVTLDSVQIVIKLLSKLVIF